MAYWSASIQRMMAKNPLYMLLKSSKIQTAIYLCQTIYRYINGEEYRGQTGEGFGIVITNKYTYTGDVKEKRANGCGRAIFNDGVIYEGELKNGVTDGVGMLISQDEIYAGEFKDGKKHGIGFVTNKNNQTTTEYYCKGEKVIDLQSARLADTISKISSNHK